MGEKQNEPFQLSFNASLKVDFQGSRVTSDGGLIVIRELDERLGLGDLITEHLTDARRGKNTQLPLVDLFRQSIYSRVAGYEDVNDAERLSQDPAFRLIGSEKVWDRGVALTSRLQTFETEMLAEEENFAGLARINRALIGKVEALDSAQRVVLDMDSTEIPVYGEQENSAYNGHFESTCYHPLLLFNREGDSLAAKLRPGNVHSAEDWEELLLPEIEQQQKLGKEVVFRADAAFAKPEIYAALEEQGVKYAIRIPANDSLERDIAELLTRPAGRPSYKPVVWYKKLLYQAASWKTARRVVAKVEFHFGELFPQVGFIVTNLETDSRAVVRFYNKRGTAEQWIKEGKQAVKMTRLSCHRFRSNEVRLWLSVIAYNLGNLWRRLVLPKRIDNWSLTSLQQRLMKTGGRLVKHARYYWLLLAESHLTRRLSGRWWEGLPPYRWRRARGRLLAERNHRERRRGVEGSAWKWLKKWDLSVLIFCGKAKAAVCRCEGGTSEKNPKTIQLHGIKRWWLVYTQLCSGTQNGNPGLLNPFRPNAPPCL